MKKLAVAAALLSLAACATPQEICISQASAEFNGLAAQARTARENIARGYAVHSQTVPYTYATTCFDDAGEPYTCQQTATRTQETPVAIDVGEERRKLARLERRMQAERPRRDAAIAQCRLVYPK